MEKGSRYYLYLLLILAWGILFLLAATAAITRISLPAILAAGILLCLGLILRNVYRALNPVRSIVHHNPFKQPGAGCEEVRFPSLDGWTLSGWFIPSQNGATIILTHEMGGNRLDMTPAASTLAESGFGLLLYDLRGHGRSAGDLDTWGWLEINDLNGAVDYLLSRPDVDPNQIGALGFSLGGQITIRAAADNKAIKAVIAEDPAPAILTDHPMPSGNSLRKFFNYSKLWLLYTLQSAVSGVPQPSGVIESVAKIAPRPLLLISSGRGRGPDLMRTYYDNAREPKNIWEVPDSGHGRVYPREPETYEAKILEFFNNWLLVDDPVEYT